MNTTKSLLCLNDEGQSVDWWFIYKVAGKSIVSDGSKAKGTEYVYFDSSFHQGDKLVLSKYLVSDQNDGALANTLNQIYTAQNDDLGWFFYNDENPITGITNPSRGHTKGVLAFDFKSNTAFWLIHSTPKFALKGAYGYPDTAVGNAQTFLCVTLKDANESLKIAQEMYRGQQPNVYLSSAVPKSLVNKKEDARVALLQDHVKYGDTPYADVVPFHSAAGTKFLAISKNKHWDTPGDDDFYNDLVAVKLNENIEVETWEHGKTPNATDANSSHRVVGDKSVDLKSLNISPSYAWSEENDHAKLAISDKSEKHKYVCVGDINFTIAQEKRSGGTVAFLCPPLWKSLWEIISPNPFHKKKKK